MSDPAGFTLLAQALVDVVLDGLQQVQVQENIGLGNVNNTSDVNKPVSTAQATAISVAVSAAVAALTKASVGLGNVDNTSDVNKPVSTAQATADGLRVLKGGDTMTGLLILSGAPGTGLGAATKTYVDTADALALLKAGGTMMGAITLAADPAAALQPATKQYVDLKAPINNAVFTGTTTLAADPSLALQAATKQYVDATVNALLDAANAEQFKGLIDASGNPNYPAASSGWVYKISVAGLIGGGSGVAVEIGDRVQCIVDGSAAGNQATVGANWWITQANVGFSSNGISLVTAANYAAMRTLLAMTVADITDMSANGRSLVSAANYAAMKTLLAYTVASITDMTANGRSLVTAADYAAMKVLLSLVKGDVGLGNVDNTSDVNKPVSTAQATADNLRVLISNVNANVMTWLTTPTSANFATAMADEVGTDKVAFQTNGTVTPTDASGGGLGAFTGVSIQYMRTGNWCVVYGTLTMPSTADAVNDMCVGGLPFPVPNTAYAAVPGPLTNTAGINGAMARAIPNTSTFKIYKSSTATFAKNADLTLNTINFTLGYPLV